MTIRSQLLAICLFCSTAYAFGGDNTHTQGVRLAGRGFDESATEVAAPPIVFFDNKRKIWPPQGDYEASIGNQRTLKISVNCSAPETNSSRFALCFADGISVVEPAKDPVTAFCDFDDSRKGKVPLLAIQGKWRNGLELADDVVTFACAPIFSAKTEIKTMRDFEAKTAEAQREIAKNPSGWTGWNSGRSWGKDVNDQEARKLSRTPVDLSNMDMSHNQGVLAKCFFWGFAKIADAQLKTYEACVRAARADYCGDGRSLTEAGTWIQIYEPIGAPRVVPPKIEIKPQHCSRPYFRDDKRMCFEALWNENQAICVSRPRFDALKPTECAGGREKQFPVTLWISEKGGEGGVVIPAPTGTGVEIRCTLRDYDEVRKNALIKNRSFVNKLDGTTGTCRNEIPCP